jgi:hypothetical protein
MPPTQDKTFKVTNMSQRLHHYVGLQIPPGSTVDIPLEFRDTFRKSFGKVRPQELVEGDTRANLPPPKLSPSLSKLKSPEAIEMVNVESDLAQLGVWLDDEKRLDVIAAIKARGESLSK